jgi:type VI secretion system secreted protein VgrG
VEKRPLSAEEIKVAQSIFKDSIDYTRVHICDSSQNAMITKDTALIMRNEIHIENDRFTHDFTKAYVGQAAQFIFFMAIIWQHQNDVFKDLVGGRKEILRNKFNRESLYRYTIDANKTFEDYTMPQQASLLGDYYLICHDVHPNHVDFSIPIEVIRVQYETVLKDFLKNPAYIKDAKIRKAQKALATQQRETLRTNTQPFHLKRRPKP